MFTKNVYCIVGRSGTGKTTLANNLKKTCGFLDVDSYTTRPKRTPDEKGHTFVDDDSFDKLKNIVAFNCYNGYKYAATKEQIEAANLYVVDIPGVLALKNKYRGSKGIVVIGLDAEQIVCFDRMKKRGDSDEKAKSRIELDNAAFSSIKEVSDFCVDVGDMTADEVERIVRSYIGIKESF